MNKEFVGVKWTKMYDSEHIWKETKEKYFKLVWVGHTDYMHIGIYVGTLLGSCSLPPVLYVYVGWLRGRQDVGARFILLPEGKSGSFISYCSSDVRSCYTDMWLYMYYYFWGCGHINCL